MQILNRIHKLVSNWRSHSGSRFSRGTATPNDVEFHKSKIDPVAFRRVHAQYIDVDPYPGFSKYLDSDTWIRTALSHVQILDIPSEKRLSILDIGTGAGYFSFVCQNLGHCVHSIDVRENEFYTDMVRLLGVERCEHRIEPFQPLPDFGQRFDRVTAFAICFNGHATDALWKVAEWDFFLNDVVENHLSPDGMITLKFNPEPDGSFFSSDLQQRLLARGASINGPIVRISP